jgi:hypothetical protein
VAFFSPTIDIFSHPLFLLDKDARFCDSLSHKIIFHHLVQRSRGGDPMKRTLLIATVMIFAASMMGCGETIMPCNTDEDCVIDWDFGWDNQAASGHDWGGDIGMTCNTDVSALEKCNEVMGWLQELMDGDWLPIPDLGELDICGWMFGDETAVGTCEITGLPW